MADYADGDSGPAYAKATRYLTLRGARPVECMVRNHTSLIKDRLFRPFHSAVTAAMDGGDGAKAVRAAAAGAVQGGDMREDDCAEDVRVQKESVRAEGGSFGPDAS